MKQSQMAILSVVGVVAGTIIVAAVGGRIALSRMDSEELDPGERVSRNPDLTGFSEIEIDGRWRVTVTRGEEWRVALSYPENVEGEVEAYVQGERLRLRRTAPGFWFGGPNWVTTADIVMPALEELALSGNGRLELSGFEGDRLDIDLAGAVQLEGRDGRYRELDLSVAGAGEIDLHGIAVTEAQVDLAGAADVTLTMNGGELSGSMTGAGQLRYYGSVSREAVDVAGVGRVRRVE